MAAGDPDEGLASFVPARVGRRSAADLAVPDAARAEEFFGAVLLADISGFTALTESLARRGEGGAEELTRCLNVYFGRLIDLIVEHGGDVIKFAGDALLAVWTAADGELGTAACRAAQCGLAAQERLHDFPVTADVRLSLRIGLSAGPLAILHVGGVDGRWEIVATGEPLAGMNAASAQARPGELAVSPAAWALVQDRIAGEPLAGGYVRIRGVREPIPLLAQVPMPAAPSRALLAYVPRVVVDQIARGGASWLAELRRVTVLFVNFPGLTPATPLERAQAVMRELHAVLHRYEGTINKLSLDDKGASLVAAFGLPPLSHEDDPERGVRAALAVRERFAAMQVRHSTGIATGTAFCGVVGNTTRREYTMIGDVVNLAARLMQAAKGSVLCDRATYDASRARLAFELLPSIHVKGKRAEIAVFHPTGELSARRGAARAEAAGTLVGRLAEQRAIEEVFGALATRGEGAVVVFEGMAGIGKSRLLQEARRLARRAGIACREGGGDAMEKSTAYHAWRGVFEQWSGVDPGAGADERQARVSARVAAFGRQEWTERLPLLNLILRTAFPPTGTTAAINQRARAAATHDLVADLLAFTSHEGAREAVIFDDAHWMDSASLALASRLALRQAPLVMIFAMRPIPGPALDDIQALSRAPGARHFVLAPLGPDESVALACRSLDEARVPEAVAAVIRSKADGNPLLIQELVQSLRDRGLIRVSDGVCRVAPGAGDLRSVNLPDSIQAAVTARLDRLSPSQRLLLKIASVVGRLFESDVVLRLYPGSADEESLIDDLNALEDMRITVLERSDPTRVYAFGHLAFHDVTYRLMLFSQRRQLHQAMAELLEERHAADLPAVYPLLAVHWRKAAEGRQAEAAIVWKAIDRLHRAGEQALQHLAYHEAVDFLSGALELLEDLPDSVERARRELALCCAIGAPLRVTRGFAAPETQRAYERASELCQQLENSPEQFDAVYGLWSFALVKADLSLAQRLAAELFRVAAAADDPELLLPAHRAAGGTALWLGAPTTARDHLEQAMALYRPEHHARGVLRSGQNQGVVSSALSAWALWLLGYPDTALVRIEDALAHARRLSHPHTEAMTIFNLTTTHQFRREAAAIVEKAEALAVISRDQGFPLWLAGATIMLGWARSQLGRPGDGIDDMRQGIDGWRSTGAELAAPYYLGLLAEAYGAAGQPDAGLDVVGEALASSTRSGEAWWRAELLRIEAELRLTSPAADHASAERLLLEALDLARVQRARSLELRAAASLCRLWRKQRRPPREAERPLAEVLLWFTEGDETADLREAAALLGVNS